MQKQNHLQSVMQNQKKQLFQIQQKISLHKVNEFETSKQLQRQVQILEQESRKQHEERQKELKSSVIQKGTKVNTSETTATQDVSQCSQYSGIGPNSQDPRILATEPHSITCDEQITPQKYASTHWQQRPELSHVLVSSSETVESFQTVSTAVDLDTPVRTQQMYTVPTPRDAIRSSPSSEQLLQTSPADNAPKQPSFKDLSPTTISSMPTMTTAVNTSTRATTSESEDYFSKFSPSELETFLSISSLPSATSLGSGECSTIENTEKSEKSEESTHSNYDSLLQQQKLLLQMQEV